MQHDFRNFRFDRDTFLGRYQRDERKSTGDSPVFPNNIPGYHAHYREKRLAEGNFVMETAPEEL